MVTVKGLSHPLHLYNSVLWDFPLRIRRSAGKLAFRYVFRTNSDVDSDGSDAHSVANSDGDSGGCGTPLSRVAMLAWGP